MDEKCPIDQEALLATAVEILKRNIDEREIELLTSASPKFEVTDYDNWNGGTYTWGLRIAVDPRLYAAIHENADSIKSSILKIGQSFFEGYDNHSLDRVTFVPVVQKNSGWREAIRQQRPSDQGVNNQGRVRSDNVASLTCDGLKFRSQPEINLYQVLKKLGLTFAPLPVFIRGGESYRRLEPDFVILKDSVLMVVEVDGGTQHPETPVEAHERLQILDHEGAKIERVKAAECDTLEKASVCAAKLVKILEKRIAQRG